MNDAKLRQMIQLWEYEGGALLPPNCNVHFWRDPRRHSTSGWQHAAENQLTARQEFTDVTLTSGARSEPKSRNN
jgi:hypothetical protein